MKKIILLIILVANSISLYSMDLKREGGGTAFYSFEVYNSTNQEWSIGDGKLEVKKILPNSTSNITVNKITKLELINMNKPKSKLLIDCFSDRDKIFSRLLLAEFKGDKYWNNVYNTSDSSRAIMNINSKEKYKVTLTREQKSLKENLYGIIRINAIA